MIKIPATFIPRGQYNNSFLIIMMLMSTVHYAAFVSTIWVYSKETVMHSLEPLKLAVSFLRQVCYSKITDAIYVRVRCSKCVVVHSKLWLLIVGLPRVRFFR